MKICVFGDIHGNFWQLEKLMRTKDFLDADLRICVGDVVGLGPYQKECMDLLSKFDHILLMGNHEARMIKLIDALDPVADKEIYDQFDLYRNQLKDYLEYFKNLPFSYSLDLLGKKFYFTHYGWHNSNMSNKFREYANKNLLEQFKLKEDEYDYVIYGHIHTPSETKIGKTNFIDIGSLGLKSPSNYLTIDDENGKVNIQRKTIEFDVEKFMKDCERLNYPKWHQLKQFSFDNALEKNFGTVLVTGGGGYIGSNVVAKLAEKGYQVVVIDNFSNSYPSEIEKLLKKYSKNVKLYDFDLLDSQKLEEVLKKENIYSVIHLAGKKYVPESFKKEKEYYDNNVVLTQNLLNLLEKNHIKNLVFSSSITVYGKPQSDIIDENEPCSPLSPYAKQKLDCEEMIKAWQKRNNSSAVILRLSNPVGANANLFLGDKSKMTQYKGVMPSILEKAKQGETIVVNGGDHPTKDGTTVRDYIHVEDVASAFVSAVEKGDGKFNIYNVGSSMPGYSVLDILHQTEKCLNKKVNCEFGARREGDVSVFISNNSKAKNNINLKITKNLHDMVQSQIDFEKSIDNSDTERKM